MKNLSILYLALFFFDFNFTPAFAQSTLNENIKDLSLKDSLYTANKHKVLNYSMKEFDALFFEFFEKKTNPNLLLRKIEFYTYTVKIAAFSDRLANLYPAQIKTAIESKKKWMTESYEDYLLYKASQKK
jgi:hypothetical protein